MKIYLRLATESDCDLLFKWTNDQEVRRNSFNTNPIKYDEHKSWFIKKLSSNESYIFICYLEKTPVGQIRFDVSDKNKGTISYSVDYNYRKKGVGKSMISLLEDILFNMRSDIKELIAYVKHDNKPSQSIFRNLGYTEIKQDEGLKYFKSL